MSKNKCIIRRKVILLIMIVSKTDLENLPKSCDQCYYSKNIFSFYSCSIKELGIPIDYNIKKGNLIEKPYWCPLIEIND